MFMSASLMRCSLPRYELRIGLDYRGGLPWAPANVRRNAGPVAHARAPQKAVSLKTIDVPLERDVFLRSLLAHLSGALQDIIGIEEAAGFISIVGQRMGDEINTSYQQALKVDQLSRAQVRDVCIDLKRRILGDFYVVEEDDEKIVFANRVCPFNEQVVGRPALCMMTSNVFGTIAAENLGYGKVVLEQSLAKGDPGCRVVLYLQRTPAAQQAVGREYLRGD